MMGVTCHCGSDVPRDQYDDETGTCPNCKVKEKKMARNYLREGRCPVCNQWIRIRNSDESTFDLSCIHNVNKSDFYDRNPTYNCPNCNRKSRIKELQGEDIGSIIMSCDCIIHNAIVSEGKIIILPAEGKQKMADKIKCPRCERDLPGEDFMMREDICNDCATYLTGNSDNESPTDKKQTYNLTAIENYTLDLSPSELLFLQDILNSGAGEDYCAVSSHSKNLEQILFSLLSGIKQKVDHLVKQ